MTTRQQNVILSRNFDPRTNQGMRARMNRTRVTSEARGEAEDLIQLAREMEHKEPDRMVREAYTAAWEAIQKVFKLHKPTGYKLLEELKEEQRRFNQEVRERRVQEARAAKQAVIDQKRQTSLNEQARQEGLSLGRRWAMEELKYDALQTREGMMKAITLGVIEDPFKKAPGVVVYNAEEDRVKEAAPTACTHNPFAALASVKLPEKEEKTLSEMNEVAEIVEESLESKLFGLISAIEAVGQLEAVAELVGQERMADDATPELIAEIEEAAEIVADLSS